MASSNHDKEKSHHNAATNTDTVSLEEDWTPTLVDIEKAEHDEKNKAGTASSQCSSDGERPEHNVISWSINDPGNPHNWSATRKVFVVIAGIVLVFNSTFGSSIAAGASQQTADYFNVTNTVQLVLPTSLFLVGYVLGPLLTAPMSESYGRKPILFVTFLIYTAFSLGCALAPTWAGLVVMRLLCGMGAGTPISVVGGVYADIYKTPQARGTAIMIFMTMTILGPLVGPPASGYLAVVSWRWAYWLQLIIAGVSWPIFIFMPETYGPVLLKRKAAEQRQETGDVSIVAPIELENKSMQELITVILARPFRMFLFEAIVLSSCLYMAMVYAVFYMFLQAYPLIFEGVYGFSPGEEGLTFLAIFVGSVMASGVYFWWDHYYEKKRAQNPAPKWTAQEEYHRVPIACIAGPLFAASIFWLGWAARPDVHWIVPTLAGIPFGLAYVLIFMGLINYIVDAYEAFSASALAASSCSRSLFGVILPFAVPSMFSHLGIAWACSVLGFISLALGVIPFVFIRFGEKLRANSEFCQELRRLKEKEMARNGP
ncbi:hypothetical protein AMS68_002086 [Peltaster fructicola]|uniref:Major facilitator superfamily (MFS) profile domain-containing protein n=1 Tax=Peltaster fructicola TaxID=286661 RepID=A0A6H0XPM0_9PEZI|nr:hypothetical protein AMS68_002086 [Peltaster fructicola]